MRRRGASIKDVSKKLGIPLSTLSYWFRTVHLTNRQMARLKKRNDLGLIAARKKAVAWHRAQKDARLATARKEARVSLAQIDSLHRETLELALAFLYLGEGSKKNSNTALGNSDPRILLFFLNTLEQVYGLPRSAFKCHLHLRADQDPKQMTRYWSCTLGIPQCNFLKPILDSRTRGKTTYAHYKGVCALSCGHVEIQRKLMYIATEFCDTVAKHSRAVSSLGRASR
ncbi:MAG: hypothetical protein RLZZ342_653 [Candidatus Parcubacteria bacterium]